MSEIDKAPQPSEMNPDLPQAGTPGLKESGPPNQPTTQRANDPAPQRPKDFESFSWRVRLSDNEPAKQWIIFGVALSAFILGTLVYRKPLLGILGSVMILAATAEFWLGTRYKLDGDGASSTTGASHSRILWKDVKRAVITPVGIKLSPLEESSRLAAFRGVFLRYGREDRLRIECEVRKLGGNDVRFVEGTAD